MSYVIGGKEVGDFSTVPGLESGLGLQVCRYDPGSLLLSTEEQARHNDPQAYRPEALDIAAALKASYPEAMQVGAERLATEIASSPGMHFVARTLGLRRYDYIAACSYTEESPEAWGGDQLCIINALEVPNSFVGTPFGRSAASAILSCMIAGLKDEQLLAFVLRPEKDETRLGYFDSLAVKIAEQLNTRNRIHRLGWATVGSVRQNLAERYGFTAQVLQAGLKNA